MNGRDDDYEVRHGGEKGKSFEAKAFIALVSLDWFYVRMIRKMKCYVTVRRQ